jgi:hypothetical protein
MDNDHFGNFCKDVRVQVTELIGAGVKGVTDRQDAMFRRMRGTGTAGMTFATSSFSVYAIRDNFHLNFPAQLADDATVAAVLAKVDELAERHGVELDVRKKVKGGSNFVLEGRLSDVPAPGPTP